MEWWQKKTTSEIGNEFLKDDLVIDNQNNVLIEKGHDSLSENVL